jgi:hypothetical protein
VTRSHGTLPVALLAACTWGTSPAPAVDSDVPVVESDGPTDRPDTSDLGDPAPTASVRPTQQLVAPDALARLDASGSVDVRGDPLTFTWTLAEDAPAATLAPAGDEATLRASIPGTYGVRLVASDGARSDDDTALVHVSATTRPPRAEARAPARPEPAGTPVVIDGSGSSDPDGDALTYAWTLSSPDGSAATLDLSDPARPVLTPDVDGAYTLVLRVSDGVLTSWPAWAVVSVGDGGTGEDAHPTVR